MKRVLKDTGYFSLVENCDENGELRYYEVISSDLAKECVVNMSVLRDDFKDKNSKPYKIDITYGVRMNVTNTDSFLRTFITCLEEAIIARETFINYFKSNDNWSEE